MPRHRQDFTVVGAVLDHHIDLDRRQVSRSRRVDAFQDFADRIVGVVHAFEYGVVDSVQADRDTVQACVAQAARTTRQQRAVSSQGQLDSGNRRQLFDQPFDVFPQQRFATGQPDLADALIRKQAGQTNDFLVGEQLLLGKKWVTATEHRFRHAVNAAKVAAVGDRDAQVAHRPAAAIGCQLRVGRLRLGHINYWRARRKAARTSRTRASSSQGLVMYFQMAPLLIASVTMEISE